MCLAYLLVLSSHHHKRVRNSTDFTSQRHVFVRPGHHQSHVGNTFELAERQSCVGNESPDACGHPESFTGIYTKNVVDKGYSWCWIMIAEYDDS